MPPRQVTNAASSAVLGTWRKQGSIGSLNADLFFPKSCSYLCDVSTYIDISKPPYNRLLVYINARLRLAIVLASRTYLRSSRPSGDNRLLRLVPLFICTHDEHTVAMSTKNWASLAWRISQTLSLSQLEHLNLNKEGSGILHAVFIPACCACSFGQTDAI